MNANVKELDIQLFTKTGKPRKRRPKTKNVYFTDVTQDAILRFRDEEDQLTRDLIYRDHIEYAFFKLTQNIINTYKYWHTDGLTIEELQQEVICFLLKKMHLFNPDLGKAYSYFGTITRRYLIGRNVDSYKKMIQQSNLESIDFDSSLRYAESFDIEYKDLDAILLEFIETAKTRITTMFSDAVDINVANTIIYLFERVDKVQIFSKKAALVYIREMNPDVSNTKINSILKSIYKIYQEISLVHNSD